MYVTVEIQKKEAVLDDLHIDYDFTLVKNTLFPNS